MSKPQISIIVPVYKVEPYLEFCVDSVLSQTFRDFELILVDDGSPDRCPAICDSYAEKDARVQVIHKKNGGLSSARNAGIEKAAGEYLCFIDSDDYISPVYVEHLHQAAMETEADMVICRVLPVTDSKIPESSQYGQPEEMTKEDAFDCLFSFRNVEMVVAWNKLYVRRLFEDIRYPIGKLHEDEATIHFFIGQCDKIAWLEEPLYFYRKTEGSITNSRYSLRRLDELSAKESRLAFFKEKGYTEFYDKLSLSYCSLIMRHYRTVLHEISDVKQRENTLKELYAKFCETYQYVRQKPMQAKQKIRFCLFKRCPRLVAKMEYRKYEGKEQ